MRCHLIVDYFNEAAARRMLLAIFGPTILKPVKYCDARAVKRGKHTRRLHHEATATPTGVAMPAQSTSTFIILDKYQEINIDNRRLHIFDKQPIWPLAMTLLYSRAVSSAATI